MIHSLRAYGRNGLALAVGEPRVVLLSEQPVRQST